MTTGILTPSVVGLAYATRPGDELEILARAIHEADVTIDGMNTYDAMTNDWNSESHPAEWEKEELNHYLDEIADLHDWYVNLDEAEAKARKEKEEIEEDWYNYEASMYGGR